MDFIEEKEVGKMILDCEILRTNDTIQKVKFCIYYMELTTEYGQKYMKPNIYVVIDNSTLILTIDYKQFCECLDKLENVFNSFVKADIDEIKSKRIKDTLEYLTTQEKKHPYIMQNGILQNLKDVLNQFGNTDKIIRIKDANVLEKFINDFGLCCKETCFNSVKKLIDMMKDKHKKNTTEE